MKLLFLILLLPALTNGQLVNIKFIPDSFNSSINSPIPTSDGWNRVYSVELPKYDTIGPMLRLVSDTAHDHWNGVSAMWVYEVTMSVREVKSTSAGYWDMTVPHHIAWLDNKKKPLTLKVWQ